MKSINENKENILFWGSIRTIDNFIVRLNPYMLHDGYKFVLLTNSDIWGKVETHDDIIDIAGYNLIQILNKIKNIAPRILVISNYKSLMNYIIIKIARILKIKIIYIQHGIFDTEVNKLHSTNKYETIKKYLKFIKLFYQFNNIEKISNINKSLFDIIIKRKLKKYYELDYAIVYTEYSAEFLKKHLSISRKNIYLSGYPIYDSIKDEEIHNELKTQFEARINGSKIITLLHQPIGTVSKDFNVEDDIKYIRELKSIIEQSGYRFVVKLHPKTNVEEYLKLDPDLKRTLVRRCDLKKLISISDIILGFFSTALFYAVMFNKPIIQVFYPSYDYPYYIFDKISIKAKNKDDLKNILLDHLQNDKQKNQKYIEKYIGYNNSFESIAQIMSNIISGLD
jgi:CDP-Glycerol:Poly(glycerophosphate) glycerophosphotransferase